MKLDDALALLIENILRAPDRLVSQGAELTELKSRIEVLEYDKSIMIDRITILEKLMKRKKNR